MSEITKDYIMYMKELNSFKYLSESKVFQYFDNGRQNSVAPDAFAKVVKVTNHNGLWNATPAWYSLSTIYLIFCYVALKSTVLSLPKFT